MPGIQSPDKIETSSICDLIGTRVAVKSPSRHGPSEIGNRMPPHGKCAKQKGDAMRRITIIPAAALALFAGPALAQQKTVKIGFISTFSRPVAAIGNDMKNSFELGLDQHGRKLGGLPVRSSMPTTSSSRKWGAEDPGIDRVRPCRFRRRLYLVERAARFAQADVDSKTMTIVTNAGPKQLAGDFCSPYVFSTSWQNDQTPAAVGRYMNEKGVKTAFLLGPNYAAGKDMLAGVQTTFKGQIVGQELTRWPDQLDFSAELSKAREAKPDAIFVFYPGGAGVQFVTQYAQAGLKGQIPLYTAFTIDDMSLPRLKDLAVGVPGAQEWVNDLPNDANKKFVADYQAKYHASPSFYGAQTYDAVDLIDSAITAVKGDLSNKEGMRKEMERPTSSRSAATSSSATTTSRSRISICRSGEERRRHFRAQDRRHDRQRRSRPLPRQVPDEVTGC